MKNCMYGKFIVLGAAFFVASVSSYVQASFSDTERATLDAVHSVHRERLSSTQDRVVRNAEPRLSNVGVRNVVRDFAADMGKPAVVKLVSLNRGLEATMLPPLGLGMVENPMDAVLKQVSVGVEECARARVGTTRSVVESPDSSSRVRRRYRTVHAASTVHPQTTRFVV